MLRKIKSLNFMVFRNSKANDHIHDLENYQCTHYSEYPRDPHADELIHKLMRIAFNQTRRQNTSLCVFENRVDRAGSEDAGKHSANRAAGPVHSKGVQSVIIAKARFDL